MKIVRSQYWDDTYGLFVMTKEGVIRVVDAEIQEPVLPFVIPVRDTGMALLHRSSEKNWQLLTKFIINSHLTVEEKICHKK